MDFKLARGHTFTYTANKVPIHLRRYAMPYTQAVYRVFPEGEILSQVYLGMDFSIWLHWFLVKQHSVIQLVAPEDALILKYMLMGNFSCALSGFGEVLLEQNKYQLFYIPGLISHEASFQKGTYCCMHINFQPVRLRSISQQYPSFEPLLAEAERKLQKANAAEPSVITPTLKGVIDDIITQDLGAWEQTFYIESSVRDLLRHYIHEQGMRAEEKQFGHYQMKIMTNVHEYILRNLDSDVSVNKLASTVGVSRSWLQRVSQKCHNKAIHELVTDLRMNEAARLLLTTDMQVSQVIVRVSRSTLSGFSAAFSKYFGQTPSDFRRNRGQKRQI